MSVATPVSTVAQTKVLHISDPHLRNRESGSDIWAGDFTAAFEQAVDVAVERDVDAVVHTGDRFDDPRPALPTITRWADVLAPLRERDIPVYVIAGDHDRRTDDQWIDPVRRTTGLTRLGREPSVVGDTAVYGIDAVRPHEWQSTDFSLQEPPADVDSTILCLHELLEPPGDDLTADPLLEDVLDRVDIEIDALVLGGRTQPARARVDGTDIWFAGPTDRTEPDGAPAGLVQLLEIDDGTMTRQQLELEPRPAVSPTIRFATGEGIARVRDVLDRYDLADHVATIEIVLEDGTITATEATEMAGDAGVAVVDGATDERATEKLPTAQNAVETAALLGFRRRSGREAVPAAGNAVEAAPGAGTAQLTELEDDDGPSTRYDRRT